MIQPRLYNTTYFRPKQRCNAILVEVVRLSTIGNTIDENAPRFKIQEFYLFVLNIEII